MPKETAFKREIKYMVKRHKIKEGVDIGSVTVLTAM